MIGLSARPSLLSLSLVYLRFVFTLCSLFLYPRDAKLGVAASSASAIDHCVCTRHSFGYLL